MNAFQINHRAVHLNQHLNEWALSMAVEGVEENREFAE